MKKLISSSLAVILAFGGMLMLTSCKTHNNDYLLEFITTPLYSGDNTKSHPYCVSLQNNDFKVNPSEFNPTLAKTALIMSSSAYNFTYAMDNLDKLSFEHKAKFNYDDNYSQDGVGTIIASRKTEDTTLIFIILRGTLKKEWYSNFDIGRDISKTGVHEGFSKARDFVSDKLEMFMINYGIDRDHCKFFVTGHSRGAAVANLLSKSLIDIYGPNNVYAYTFATPNTTTKNDVSDPHYSGIFNFVNPEDFIAYIPLENWGFKKYGTTITFPKTNSDNYKEKLKRVGEYYEQYKGRQLKTFGGTDSADAFFEAAEKLAPTVKDYYDTKYDIAGLKLSLYEYMDVLAHILNEENTISNGLILLGSESTPFEPLTNHILSGMDISQAIPSLDYEDSLISYAHTAETYLAWLEVYIENM